MAEAEGGAPRAAPRLRSFHELMRHRVQRILFVSSLYDSFVMSEEGQLPETLLSHFIDLNRSSIPDLVQVEDTASALELLEHDDDFDLVVSSLYLHDGDALGLAGALRGAGHEQPVMGLGYSSRELKDFTRDRDTSGLERLFLWQGDIRVFLAMVFYMEDRLNVETDTGGQGVPAIIVVEDDVRFYSSFLTTIYAEVVRHASSLLSEDLNASQKMIRLRARPKVLLCTTYEEAWGFFDRYSDYVLGIVSDFEYPMGGSKARDAGVQLCRRALERRPDIRLVMQSSVPENRRLASELGASFLTKGSPVLLQELREILVERFGFGEFRFRDQDGSELDRAADLRQLRKRLAVVPLECVEYHARHGHFANWLKARTELDLADAFLAAAAEEPAGEALRERLLAALARHRTQRDRTVVADFDRHRFSPSVSITRIGAGSLGGKARGLAFANRMLHASGLQARFPDVEVLVPPCAVVATGVFDEFLEYEWMHDFAMRPKTDEQITQLFLQAPFPRDASSALRSVLQKVSVPLAVRSSSLMEDSLSQPFAGVYETFMLPNDDPDFDRRFRRLTDAVKLVYASTFTERAKSYLTATSHRVEEEKMAVIIQELVGNRHGERFYPDFAGVARSYSFYPEPGHKSEDGVAAVALGMGRTVVSGAPCLRFCPRYPRQIVGFSSVQDALQASQREFYALDLSRRGERGGSTLQTYPLEVAEQDGTLAWLGSTYDHEDHRIVDGISRAGVRLVSFAQVLKHEAYPLAELLRELLAICADSTGAPVEIEFAGTLGLGGAPARFAFLQLRPMTLSKSSDPVQIDSTDEERLVCSSTRVLGNGYLEDIHDVVVVARDRFDRARTPEIARQIASFDAQLREEGRPYVLIGLGRWGSSDPLLGIPVTWNQIAGARVIVEAGFDDMKVAPSQGTHFFQNLTASQVGYFTVNPEAGEGHLDWEWLLGTPAFAETEHARHLRLDAPLTVKMDGRSGSGVVEKPAT